MSVKLGYIVLYSDTDSIFIAKTSTCKCTQVSFDHIMQQIMRHTPVNNVKLLWKKSFNKLVLVTSKMYYGKIS
ncbi:hypothetical protein L0F63_003419, partial [Massospora cicadina]